MSVLKELMKELGYSVTSQMYGEGEGYVTMYRDGISIQQVEVYPDRWSDFRTKEEAEEHLWNDLKESLVESINLGMKLSVRG